MGEMFNRVLFSFILLVTGNAVSHNRSENFSAEKRVLNDSRVFSPLEPTFGYEFDDFKSFFSNFFQYIRFGVKFLTKKFVNGITLISDEPNDGKVNYKSYRVLRINAVTEYQTENLKNLSEEISGAEFWTPPTPNSFTDLLVSPDSLDDVKQYLKNYKVDYEILVRDLQKVISFENPKLNKKQRNLLIGKRGHPMTWIRYHGYTDMIRYMEFLAFSYPEKVELLTIGYSTENLPIKLIKISSPSSNYDEENERKPAFWIDGGIHGREWITSSVVLYIGRQLIENYSKYKDITDSGVWYLLPVANPDGYEYSHSTDRLWKKTRSKHESSMTDFIKQFFGGGCEGVDLNKNFDFHWGENGISIDPCHERYAGPRPLSEPEAKAITDFIMPKKNRFKMFLTLHAYSQKWLVPWSYTTSKIPDYKDLEKLAKKAVEAIALVTGSHYDVGSSASLVHPTSGTVEDWAKGTAGIKYSYAVALRDRGSYGFLLPAAQIVPTAKEIFVAVKVLAKIITAKK